MKVIPDALVWSSLLTSLTYSATPCSLCTKGWAIWTNYLFYFWCTQQSGFKLKTLLMILSSVVISRRQLLRSDGYGAMNATLLQPAPLTSNGVCPQGWVEFHCLFPFHLYNEIIVWPSFCSLPFWVLRWTIQKPPPISLGKLGFLNGCSSKLENITFLQKHTMQINPPHIALCICYLLGGIYIYTLMWIDI